MKKRWSDFLRTQLSLLLTVVLVLSLLQLPALADGEDVPAMPADWPETSWAEEVKSQTWEPHGLENGVTYQLPAVNDDTGEVTHELVTVDTAEDLGTKENPIAISSPEELILFGQLTDSTEGEYYILTETEYDMSAHYMTPLFPASPHGSASMTGIFFKGTLIGNGAVVKGAKIQAFGTGEQVFCGGLFGQVSGDISGLTLKDSTIVFAGGNYAGGLAVNLAGTLVDCHIENVSFWGSAVDNRGSTASFGGLVGEAQRGAAIADCTTDISYAEVNNKVAGDESLYIGGLVGDTSDMTIVNCKANARDSIQPSVGECGIRVGGLVGRVFNTTINNCTATVDGSITANTTLDAYAGGLVGDFYGTMTNCTATVDGTITASTTGEYSKATAGALVGNNGSSQETATITGCSANAQTGPDGPLGAVGYAANQDTVSDTSTTLLLGSSGVSVTLTGEDKASSVSEDGEKLIMTFDPAPSHEVVVTHKGGAAMTVSAGKAFTVSSDGTVTSDESTMYPVTFDSQGGSDVPGEYITSGSTVKKPSDPSRSGFNFTGWYTDVACVADSLWNFESDTATASLTLYAGWEKIPEPEPEPEPKPDPEPDRDSDSDPTYRPDVDRTEGGTVKTIPSNPTEGSRVTITPKPDSGYEVDEVIVTDRKGASVEVTRREDGTYTFHQPRGKVTIKVTYRPVETAWINPFVDVPADAWYYDAVEYVNENGLMAGTSANTFAPDLTTTRGMIVTILYRLEGSPNIEDEIWGYPFADVDANAYCATAVYWARMNGIVAGYSDELFGPNDTITREQMAAILYRYAQYKGLDTTERADLSKYADAAQVGSWAMDAIRWANAEDLIGGTSNTTLSPQGSATRAQVAVILMRFCQNIEKS